MTQILLWVAYVTVQGKQTKSDQWQDQMGDGRNWLRIVFCAKIFKTQSTYDVLFFFFRSSCAGKGM
jgi:hypothetical protein